MGSITVTFNEVDLGTTYSCKFFRTDTDTSPAREMTKISIPSRSGNLLIDGHKYPNVENEYTAVFYGADADSNAVALKNFLLSQVGYKRLTDSEHLEEYYMARISKNIEPVISEERGQVKMELVFDRKPQRYLHSGDTQYSPQSGVVVGNPIYTSTGSVDETSVSVAISIPFENGALHYSDEQNYANQLNIAVDDNRIWHKLFYPTQVIEANISPTTGGTITKKLQECPPSSEWVKDPAYGRVFYAPFVPDGTIIAATFFKFRANSSTKFLGFLSYDPNVQRLYYMDSQGDLDTFREKYDKWAQHCVIVETSESVTVSDPIDIPDGEVLTASLNARFLIPAGDTTVITANIIGSNTLVNPTPFASLPLIRLYGNGSVTINGQAITVANSSVYVDIDCDMMDCYEGATNRNNDVTFSNYDFPILETGENTFVIVSGVTGIRVIPRWWRL